MGPDPKSQRDLGIQDLTIPDWGDPIPIEPDEVAVFWACGVTSQAAPQASRLPFAITHKPGSMLITQVPTTRAMTVLGLS